jgi:hypothetical protein
VAEPRAFEVALRHVSRKSVIYQEISGAGHGFDLLDAARARLAASVTAEFLGSVHHLHVGAQATAARRRS